MTAPTDQAKLIFDPTHKQVGFTTFTSHFDGSAEPVIRELVQNALDAATAADHNHPAKVQFKLLELSGSEIPGFQDYKSAFREARDQRSRSGKTPSQDEKMTIDRIEQCLSQMHIPVLLCVDNGCGLNPCRMTALLSEGNTDKGDGGVGSFGLGHQAAFAASDLRYVLYASRYANNGTHQTICAGQAILATRLRQGQITAAEGFYRNPTSGAWIYGTEFPADVPKPLAKHLPNQGTGTVVAIAGFNDFREDKSSEPLSTKEQILSSVAMNFAAAVHDTKLIVSFKNDAHNITRLDKSTLGSTLEHLKDSKRTHGAAGRVTGSQSYEAWLTMTTGRKIQAMDGVEIHLRKLDLQQKQFTQVHLFRQGMWINSRVEKLCNRDFGGYYPFDAVVKLERGELEHLVRAAEGPAHIGIEKKRLDRKQKQQLLKLLRQIHQTLLDHAELRPQEDEYTPEGFAILQAGTAKRKAETVRRPRTVNSDIGTLNIDLPAGSSPGKRSGGEGQHPPGRTKKGRRTGYKYVLQSSSKEGIVSAVIDHTESLPEGSYIGIRLSYASGADATCASGLPNECLLMKEVVGNNGSNAQSVYGDGDVELRVPAFQGKEEILIELAGQEAKQLAAFPHLLELDIVARLSQQTSLFDQTAKDSPV